MSIADVTELVSEASRISKRGDLANYAKMLLGFAEAELNKELRTRQMKASTSLTTDANGSVALPSDYLQAISLTYSTDIHLNKITREKADANVGGYYIDGSNLISSKASTEHTLHYYQEIPGLWVNGTNWLLTTKPELYLRALVFEAHKDAMDEENALKAQALYQRALDALKSDELAATQADTISQPRTQI